jgi:hypothetical protein
MVDHRIQSESLRCRKTVPALALIFAMLLSACATRQPADFVAEGYNLGTVDQIVVLPIVDARISQAENLALDDWVLPIAARSLNELGYIYSVEPDRSLISHVARDELEDPTPAFVKSLQPTSARWILLIALDDSTSKLTFGSTGNAEMTGYLFDRQAEKLIWRNKVLGRFGNIGLVGMVQKGAAEKFAIQAAARDLFLAFPKRG